MNKKPYYRIDKKLMHDPNLSPTAKVLYMFVLDRQRMSLKNADKFTDDKGRLFCHLRQSEIMSWTGLSERTIRSTFRELEKSDHLIVKRQGREMPNFIYLLIDGQFVTGKIYRSRPAKSTGQDRQNLPPIKNEGIKNEGIKKKEREKKTSPFLSRAPSDIQDQIIRIIKEKYLIHLMDDAKGQAENYFIYRSEREWKVKGRPIMTDDDLVNDLTLWNHKAQQFKRGGEVTKGKGKKAEPEWMDEYMDELSKMQG